MKIKYPKLGETIKYVKPDGAGDLIEGSGRVKAIFLNESLHTMVQAITDDGGAVNVDLMAVNCTDAQKDAYKTLLVDVQALTEEGNKLSQEIVTQYNEQIDALYIEAFGKKPDMGA